MAEFYVDHGAYGLASNRIGLDAPTWGVPQEGDGYSKDAATASGVAEFQVPAGGAAASETIVIAGAAITAAAALGTNTFARSTDPATCATNIVALINSASFTATVSTNVVATSGLATATNQGRNLFYARVKPGATDTVQIMWRIGSVALNHATNSSVAITHTGWGATPGVVQFIGGTSGCWGWLLSNGALGQNSSITAQLYGFLASKPTVIRVGSASNNFPSLTDTTWLRTNTGQTITMSIGGAWNRVSGSPNYTLVADSNTKWTGDSGTGVVTVLIDNTTGWGLATTWFSGAYRLSAVMRGGLKFVGKQSGGGGNLTLMGMVGSVDLHMENITCEEDTAGAVAVLVFPAATGNLNCHVVTINCDFNMLKAYSSGRSFGSNASGGYGRNFTIRNCTFNFNYTGVAQPTAALFPVGTGLSVAAVVYMSNCRITGLGAFKQAVFSNPGSWTENLFYDLVAENIEGSAVDSIGTSPWWNVSTQYSERIRRVFISNPDLGGSWRLETSGGAADWVYDAGFPTLSGLTPGGGIANAVRIFWLPSPTGQSVVRGFTPPQFRQQSRGSTGTKTITLELFLPTAITYDFLNIKFVFTFVDNTGALRIVLKTGLDLVSSGSSWTNAGSYSGHAAKKITFTTTEQIKQYTDVTLDVSLYGNCPTGTLQYLFVDPGFGVA